jgi:YfiR/HmsC-like
MRARKQPAWRSYRLRAGLLRALCCLMVIAAPITAADIYPENAVKAVFLCRLASFVAWPADADPSARFVIAVWGADDVARELQRITPLLNIADRPVEVRRVHGPRELAQAQLVFFGTGHRAELRRAGVSLLGKPVLLVSDDEYGLDDGSAINLLLVDRRIRFEISTIALQRNELKASSELLALAVRVQGPGAAASHNAETRPTSAYP